MSIYNPSTLELSPELPCPWTTLGGAIKVYTTDIPTRGQPAVDYFNKRAREDPEIGEALKQVTSFQFNGDNSFYPCSELLLFLSNLSHFCPKLRLLNLENFFCLEEDSSIFSVGEININSGLQYFTLRNVVACTEFESALLDAIPLSNLEVCSITKLAISSADLCAFLDKLFAANQKLVVLELNELTAITDFILARVARYLTTNNVLVKLGMDDNDTTMVRDDVLHDYFDCLTKHPTLMQAVHRRRPSIQSDSRFSEVRTQTSPFFCPKICL